MTTAPTPSELNRAVGISVSHASNILSGARTPSRRLAIRIWEQTGWKAAAVSDLSDAELRALSRLETKLAPDAGASA